MTKTFAVIGDPIDHSLSPNIHNAAFKELGLDCTYIAYRIPKGELEVGIKSLKSINISGFNVTIPHKIEMMNFLDETDENCKIIGATNTVAFNNGNLKGFNTDMDGFLDPIKKINTPIENSSVLLLGAGGAARSIVTAFATEKAKKITIANRSKDNGQTLVQFADKIGINADLVTLEKANDIASEYNFIVNATSIGMKNEPSPISENNINKDSIVYDIVYLPMNTDLIKNAKQIGATVIYGYEMLLGQAIHAFEIWHNIKAPYNVMKKALVGGF